jgi:hypothetical protein
MEAEEQARMETVEQARKEAEEQARKEAEVQARKEAEEQARLEAQEQPRKDTERQARLGVKEQARNEAKGQGNLGAETAGASASASSSDVPCAMCTFKNVLNAEQCEVCRHPLQNRRSRRDHTEVSKYSPPVPQKVSEPDTEICYVCSGAESTKKNPIILCQRSIPERRCDKTSGVWQTRKASSHTRRD